MSFINGQAKAVTQFGPMAGRTPVFVEYGGDDLAVTQFQVGPTPVQLALAGQHLHDYITALIATVAKANQAALREALEAALREAVEEVAS